MMQTPLGSAMLSAEDGSGDAEMLSEEEGLPRCTQNNYCTNGLEIQSSSIHSELLKRKITNDTSYRKAD